MDRKEDGEPPELYQSPQVIFVRVEDGGKKINILEISSPRRAPENVTSPALFSIFLYFYLAEYPFDNMNRVFAMAVGECLLRLLCARHQTLRLDRETITRRLQAGDKTNCFSYQFETMQELLWFIQHCTLHTRYKSKCIKMHQAQLIQMFLSFKKIFFSFVASFVASFYLIRPDCCCCCS